MQEYIKKINIEYKNKFSDKTNQFKSDINEFYKEKVREIYNKSKECNITLSKDRECYYLSAFDDIDSLNRRISIYEEKLKYEKENPIYHLVLGDLYYDKAELENSEFNQSIEYLEKAIELADKYCEYMNSTAEFLLIKTNDPAINKKEMFDKGMRDYICYNSYQKDTTTIYFFESILYKYQSFSMNALSSLSNSYLYFATPDQLNDPFDITFTPLETQFDGLEVNRNDFKVCSLSKSNDNKLMWSHYTEDHTGICIGYKFLYLPNYVGKKEAKYENTILDEKSIFKNIIDYWTVKSEDWMYEEEVRLLHYGNTQKISYTFNINEATEKDIIALKIKSIYLGLKFQEKAIIKPIISEIEKQQGEKIVTYEMQADGLNLIAKEVKL
jgi:hypothetical protein